MGAWRPFFMKGDGLATTHETERQLQREISRKVDAALPGVEVLAVELQSPTRFCVYIDDARGVDHTLCARVTNVLRGYLDRYTIDVSSPGTERPLRTPGHFRNAVGRTVAVRTAQPVAGRTKFRGELIAATDSAITLASKPDPVDIPYDAVVRGNLIDEVTTK